MVGRDITNLKYLIIVLKMQNDMIWFNKNQYFITVMQGGVRLIT